MFYSDVILSKRGPLAKVWLAAHAERRLTKIQLLQTDIEESVSTIIGQDAMPMALRLSGQLLLGVVRIYSRKTKYLYDDCNDALLKLKTLFRTGGADFTTDTALASHGAVTLPTTRTDYMVALPDPALEGWDAESSLAGFSARHSTPRSGSAGMTRPTDITLRRYLGRESNGDSLGWTTGDFFDPDASNLEGGSPRPQAVQRRDSQGRLVDENGDVIEQTRDDDVSSIGIGRDAPVQQMGQRPSLLAGDISAFDDSFGADIFLPEEGPGEGIDLGLEEFEAQRRSMTPQRHSGLLAENLTPRTKAKLQEAVKKREAASRKARKQIMDSRTVLDEASEARRAQEGTEGIVLADSTHLPASRLHMRLLELDADPSKGVLPFMHIGSAGQLQFTGAQLLAPELGQLFTFDASTLQRRRRIGTTEEEEASRYGPPQKRRREGAEEIGEEFGSEIGRRAAAGSSPRDFGFGADVTFDDFGAGFDTLMEGAEAPSRLLDIEGEADATIQSGLRRSLRKRQSSPQPEQEEEERRRRAFHVPGDLQRLGTPSELSASLDSPSSSYPLRAFDGIVSSDAGASAAAAQASSSLGISRNTLRALKVLRHELAPQGTPSPTAAEEPEDARTLSFKDISRKATRRAASTFFFEMLALGTKDCLRVEQEDSYGDIKIQAKAGLWNLERAESVSSVRS